MVRPPSSEKKEYTLPPVAAQALRQALQSELDALRRVMPQGVLTFTEMWYAWTPPPRSPALPTTLLTPPPAGFHIADCFFFQKKKTFVLVMPPFPFFSRGPSKCFHPLFSRSPSFFPLRSFLWFSGNSSEMAQLFCGHQHATCSGK